MFDIPASEALEMVIVPVFVTVAAILFGRYIWTWYYQPILKFVGYSSDYGADRDKNKWSGPVEDFRIHVKNIGLKASENSKAELRLFGKTKSHTYKIQTSTHWSEGDYPTRETINRGETITFDFCRTGKIGSNFCVRFPSELGWPSYTTVLKVPTPWKKKSTSGVSPTVTKNTIDITELEEIEWETITVKVTAENAKPIEATLDIQWNTANRLDLEIIEKSKTGRHKMSEWVSRYRG